MFDKPTISYIIFFICRLTYYVNYGNIIISDTYRFPFASLSYPRDQKIFKGTCCREILHDDQDKEIANMMDAIMLMEEARKFDEDFAHFHEARLIRKGQHSTKRKIDRRMKRYERSGALNENHARHITRVDNHMHELRCTINNARRQAFKHEGQHELHEYLDVMAKAEAEVRRIQDEIDFAWNTYLAERTKEREATTFDINQLPEDEQIAVRDFLLA